MITVVEEIILYWFYEIQPLLLKSEIERVPMYKSIYYFNKI